MLKYKRDAMSSIKVLHRKEIAERQLKTAICLFLSNHHLSAVISLAGASSNILHQLVKNSDKKPFLDYGHGVDQVINGRTQKYTQYKHHVHSVLSINSHKHMDSESPLITYLDLSQCARDSLSIAVIDYITLYGKDENFISAFLQWNWERTDGQGIIDAANTIPEALKKNERWRKEIDKESLQRKKHIKTTTSPKLYHTFELAENQLITAIILFLTNYDKLSAITLAGAADGVFCELVNQTGRDNFTDILSKKQGGIHGAEIGKEINDLLHINTLKHFDEGENKNIELEIEETAVAAILKALVNYNMLPNNNAHLIQYFRSWVFTHLDPFKFNLWQPTIIPYSKVPFKSC